MHVSAWAALKKQVKELNSSLLYQALHHLQRLHYPTGTLSITKKFHSLFHTFLHLLVPGVYICKFLYSDDSFLFTPSPSGSPISILQGRERAFISSRPLFCSLWLWNKLLPLSLIFLVIASTQNGTIYLFKH